MFWSVKKETFASKLMSESMQSIMGGLRRVPERFMKLHAHVGLSLK